MMLTLIAVHWGHLSASQLSPVDKNELFVMKLIIKTLTTNTDEDKMNDDESKALMVLSEARHNFYHFGKLFSNFTRKSRKFWCLLRTNAVQCQRSRSRCPHNPIRVPSGIITKGWRVTKSSVLRVSQCQEVIWPPHKSQGQRQGQQTPQCSIE